MEQSSELSLTRRYFTEKEIARYLQVSLSLLQKMRVDGRENAIPFIKIGGAVRYDRIKVDRWLQRNTFKSTSEYDEPRFEDHSEGGP